MAMHERLEAMDADQLRAFAANLIDTLARKDQQLQEREAKIREDAIELDRRELRIQQLVHEMAVLMWGPERNWGSSCASP